MVFPHTLQLYQIFVKLKFCIINIRMMIVTDLIISTHIIDQVHNTEDGALIQRHKSPQATHSSSRKQSVHTMERACQACIVTKVLFGWRNKLSKNSLFRLRIF